jgi:hypothetical protein
MHLTREIVRVTQNMDHIGPRKEEFVKIDEQNTRSPDERPPLLAQCCS